ncbi:MAG: SDR family oxidoreductase [Bacteroidota bacterium]|nr:SDR family oxidoreductase [Bacteroidota bacterium]
MKRVLIAGGTSGIGFVTAKLLSQKGYDVTIFGRHRDTLDRAVQKLDHHVQGKIVNAADPASLKKAMSEIGAIDHLVIALSGGKGIGKFSDLDLQDLRKGFEFKFFAQLQTAQSALPFMSSNGSITFLTSISSRSKAIGTAGLGAINGAIEIMVPTLAKELKPLRINAVAPGVVNTSWWDFLTPEKKEETFSQYAKTIPLGRIAAPDDIATMVIALIENSYITGQIIAVDGGLSLD